MSCLGKQPINNSFRITASFKNAAGPVVGAAPIISVWDAGNNPVVVAQNMTELGSGVYYYDYTPLAAGVYKVHTALAANDLWGYGSFEGIDIGAITAVGGGDYFQGIVVESVMSITHADGTMATGVNANVSAVLYDEGGVSHGALVTTEIGATGMYRANFTPDAAGEWKIVWTCTSPVGGQTRTYKIQNVGKIV